MAVGTMPWQLVRRRPDGSIGAIGCCYATRRQALAAVRRWEAAGNGAWAVERARDLHDAGESGDRWRFKDWLSMPSGNRRVPKAGDGYGGNRRRRVVNGGDDGR